ncbi:MAG: hypothetical protein NC410_01780 [Oscillibacter sp.]|nr:hypothetical protein [Oscillibacter sp.]
MENIMSERNEESRHDSGQEISLQGEECRSQSLRSQVRDEHVMNNDVEALHSQGDEPDLVKYLKEKKGE